MSKLIQWVSVDPATKTGIAEWAGSKLVATGTIRPASAKEAKAAGCNKDTAHVYDHMLTLDGERVISVYSTLRSTLQSILTLIRPLVIIEEAFGESPKTISQLAARRGYISALCDEGSLAYIEVNAEEWKRVCGQEFGVAWPKATKESKLRSIALVAEQYNGLIVSDDEGDAICLGRAALRLGKVS